MLHPYAFSATTSGRVPWPRSTHRRGALPGMARTVRRRRTRMRSRHSSSRTTGPGRGRRVPRSSTARAWPSSGPDSPTVHRRLGRGVGHPRGGGGLGGSVHCRLRDAGPGYPPPAPRRAALGTGVVAARGWLATDPHRRLSPTQDRPRPQQGSDSGPLRTNVPTNEWGADRRPLVPGRRPTREDPVAAAV